MSATTTLSLSRIIARLRLPRGPRWGLARLCGRMLTTSGNFGFIFIWLLILRSDSDPIFFSTLAKLIICFTPLFSTSRALGQFDSSRIRCLYLAPIPRRFSGGVVWTKAIVLEPLTRTVGLALVAWLATDATNHPYPIRKVVLFALYFVFAHSFSIAFGALFPWRHAAVGISLAIGAALYHYYDMVDWSLAFAPATWGACILSIALTIPVRSRIFTPDRDDYWRGRSTEKSSAPIDFRPRWGTRGPRLGQFQFTMRYLKENLLASMFTIWLLYLAGTGFYNGPITADRYHDNSLPYLFAMWLGPVVTLVPVAFLVATNPTKILRTLPMRFNSFVYLIWCTCIVIGPLLQGSAIAVGAWRTVGYGTPRWPGAQIFHLTLIYVLMHGIYFSVFAMAPGRILRAIFTLITFVIMGSSLQEMDIWTTPISPPLIYGCIAVVITSFFLKDLFFLNSEYSVFDASGGRINKMPSANSNSPLAPYRAGTRPAIREVISPVNTSYGSMVNRVAFAQSVAGYRNRSISLPHRLYICFVLGVVVGLVYIGMAAFGKDIGPKNDSPGDAAGSTAAFAILLSALPFISERERWRTYQMLPIHPTRRLLYRWGLGAAWCTGIFVAGIPWQFMAWHESVFHQFAGLIFAVGCTTLATAMAAATRPEPSDSISAFGRIVMNFAKSLLLPFWGGLIWLIVVMLSNTGATHVMMFPTGLLLMLLGFVILHVVIIEERAH